MRDQAQHEDFAAFGKQLDARREREARARFVSFRNAPESVRAEFFAALGQEVAAQQRSLMDLFALHGEPWGRGRHTLKTRWDRRWHARAKRQRLREEGRLRNDGFEAERERLLTVPPADYFARIARREPGRDHKVSCPMHHERTRSCHVYPSADRGWYCFGCGAGGNIYDLACGVWSLATSGPQFRQAHEQLMELFA